MNCLGLSFKTTSTNFKNEPFEPSIYPYLKFDGLTGHIYFTYKFKAPFIRCLIRFDNNPPNIDNSTVRTLTAKLKTLKEILLKDG